MLLSILLLCFLRVSKMLYGTASGDQFRTPWARILLGFRCFASMPQGCVHRPRPPAMRLCPPSCPPRAYSLHAFALFFRVSKMLYGTASGDQFGTPWARTLLGFRCFASMPHGRVHRPCPPTTSLYDLSSYPPCAYLYVHAFAAFLRVSTMLYGTASGDQFGTPWARILLGFRCFASMPHGCVQRLCRPIRADMSSYPPCAHLSMLLSILLAVFFYGFRRCCAAPPLGINLARLGLEFCWGSAVSQACLTDAFIGYVRLYAPICPSISAMMRLYNAFVHAFVLCFLRVSQMRYGTAAGDQFGTPWARILLGFHCFASMPHGCVSSAMSTCHAPTNKQSSDKVGRCSERTGAG